MKGLIWKEISAISTAEITRKWKMKKCKNRNYADTQERLSAEEPGTGKGLNPMRGM